MPWFFHDSLADCRAGQVIVLASDQQRHLTHVLRAAAGEAITLFDGRGTVAQGTVTDTAASADLGEHGEHAERGDVMGDDERDQERAARSKGRRRSRRARAELFGIALDRVETVRPAAPAIDLATAAPKGSRLDDMVDQLSQVGVRRLILVQTSRSVVDPRASKLERIQQKAIDAAKQCHRAHVLEVDDKVQSLDDVLAMNHSIKLIADPMGTSPCDQLANRGQPGCGENDESSQPCDVLLLIGPEGGFTDDERAAAEDRGFERWCFGPHVMRIETAAAVGAGVLRAMMGRVTT